MGHWNLSVKVSLVISTLKYPRLDEASVSCYQPSRGGERLAEEEGARLVVGFWSVISQTCTSLGLQSSVFMAVARGS